MAVAAQSLQDRSKFIAPVTVALRIKPLIFDNFGDYQKTLVIETFIPEGITNVKPYRCIIRLDAEFVTDQENAELYLDYPIGIVKFDQGSGMFELDYHYSRSRIKEVK